MPESGRRRYSSARRDRQAQRTRELILDALTELLSTRPADEISTRQIAERAGVSQPTVYRHFPDRQALLEGLTARISAFMKVEGADAPLTSLDDVVANIPRDLVLTDKYAVAATAEAILNADPRRLSSSSRARTAELRHVVADEFPELGADDQHRITGLLRSFYSVQTWLRFREEFGITGSESAPILAWAFETLVREIRAGTFPRSNHPES